MSALGGAVILLCLLGLSSSNVTSSFYQLLLIHVNLYHRFQTAALRLASLHVSLAGFTLQAFDTFLQIPVLSLLACLSLFTDINTFWVATASSLFFALRAQYLFNLFMGPSQLKLFLHENALPERQHENWSQVLENLDETERMRIILNSSASNYLQLAADSASFVTFLVLLLERELRSSLSVEYWQGLIVVCVSTLLLTQLTATQVSTMNHEKRCQQNEYPMHRPAAIRVDRSMKTTDRFWNGSPAATKMSSLFAPVQRAAKLFTCLIFWRTRLAKVTRFSRFSERFLTLFGFWGLVTLALFKYPTNSFADALPYLLFGLTLVVHIIKSSRSIAAIKMDRVAAAQNSRLDFKPGQLQSALARTELDLSGSNIFLRKIWVHASLFMHNEKWVALSAARILASIDLQLCLLFLILDF